MTTGDWKPILWQQFGASIDMLEDAITACPDEVWSKANEKPQWLDNDVVGYWYLVYHTLFFLDRYLSDPLESFRPPEPFGLEELDPAGLLPERPYSKAEMQAYLEHCRDKLRGVIDELTDVEAQAPRTFGRRGQVEMSFLELQLYNLRHVQHHVGQLYLILRQQTASAPGWVAIARSTKA